MRINNNTSMHQNGTEAMDAGTRAAAVAIKDGQKMKEDGRKARRQARNDQITVMKQSADKLRKMADLKFKQGLLSAGIAFAGTIAEGVASSDSKAVTDSMKNTAKGIKAMAKAVGEIKFFDKRKDELEAERADLSTSKEIAGHHASNANEDLQHGQRTQEKMTNLMEKVLDARHRAHAAAIKA